MQVAQLNYEHEIGNAHHACIMSSSDIKREDVIIMKCLHGKLKLLPAGAGCGSWGLFLQADEGALKTPMHVLTTAPKDVAVILVHVPHINSINSIQRYPFASGQLHSSADAHVATAFTDQ